MTQPIQTERGGLRFDSSHPSSCLGRRTFADHIVAGLRLTAGEDPARVFPCHCSEVENAMEPYPVGPLTPAEHAVGVALLRRGGMPGLVAEVEMTLDPTCQHVAREVTPVIVRLAERIAPILEGLSAKGRYVTGAEGG